MTDLQCPATVVLLADLAPPPLWLGRVRVAAEFEIQGIAAVIALVEDSADLFRGETFVVRAPSADLSAALRQWSIPAALPAVVEVDFSGWRVVPER